MRIRPATVDDADAVGGLHAGSWRRFYRGAYSDAFLDGDVDSDRRAVWRARLAAPAGTVTYVADDAGTAVGFVHVVLDADPRWGSLVDNLHVAGDRRHGGIGTRLHVAAVAAVVERAAARRLHLWVLAQNDAAQRFYRARGGVHVETVKVSPPGGVPGRLNGSPDKLRMVWDPV